MATVQEIFNMTMDLMDERLNSGELSTEDTLSYQVRTPGILNLLISELLRDGLFYETYDLSLNRKKVLGGDFGIDQHYTEDIEKEVDGSAYAYHFTVDGPCTVYIEDYTSSWNVLETITVPITVSGFTNYKGSVTPTASATKSRIRFSGTYFYNYKNWALYEQNFYTVPSYEPYVKYEMPDNFGRLYEKVKLVPRYDYVNDGILKWEGHNELYIHYNFEGEVRIRYIPIPTLLTALTDEIELDEIIARQVLPYGLAAKLMIHEDLTKAQYFETSYLDQRVRILKKQPVSASEIEDIYGGYNG